MLHALVAAAFVEATLRAWGIRRADSRLRFWLLALAFPFLVLPLLLVAAPFRATDRFAAASALFASQRWNAVRLAGLGIDTIAFGVLALAGTLLFLRDVVPFVVAAADGRREDRVRSGALSPAALAVVTDLAGRLHAAAPAVTVLRTDEPVLFVRGVLRQTLVLSEGVLTRLSAEELRAAVAHEIAHARFRDPLLGWLLMTGRLVMFWNPAVQLVARAIVQEMEHRADAIAAELTDAHAFAAALRCLARTPCPAGAGGRATPGRDSDADGDAHAPAGRGFGPAEMRNPRRRIELLAERLHDAHIAARVDSVLAPSHAPRFAAARLALVGATLAVLVFFVV